MKLIDKDALVAEIERIRRIEVTNNDVVYNGALDEIRYYIDTLEVKEVDLESEWVKHFENRGDIATVNIKHLAKHFFELGMQFKEQQLMAKAVDGVVTFDYYDSGNKTYGCVAHDSFCLEDFGLKDRDKVKVIVIKED